MIRRYLLFSGILAALLGALLLLIVREQVPTTSTISGVVFGENGTLGGALVRVRATNYYTRADAYGRFVLDIPPIDKPLYLTAWSPGYTITGTDNPVSPDAETIELFLHRYPADDNPEYQFISPTHDMDNPTACGHCHTDRSGVNPAMPVDEWLQDAHSQSAINPRFLSLYNGTDLAGNVGTLTDYRYDEQFAINVPMINVDVGFKLDFPEQAGNCTTCHMPIAALNAPYTTDPNLVHDAVALEGVSCDFCHKIADVRLQDNGLPYPDMSGVLSLEMLRPPDGEQIFIGPYDDVVGDDIFSALQNRSEICAACHSASFWGVPMYNSFGEWLASPYSADDGQTCQDCHMPHVGVTTFAQLPPDDDSYVPVRDPDTIFSHLMPGAADEHLLRNTAELAVAVARADDTLQVMVRVTNTGAGHHIPTDNPLRNLILVVSATDETTGETLTLLDGATIPNWGGVGNPDEGYYAGQAGVLYAKVLTDFYTGETPTFSYWRQTTLHSDNRIPALATDESHYTFALENSETVTINARLYLRRAFIDLMDAKNWDTPDILMEQVTMVVSDD